MLSLMKLTKFQAFRALQTAYIQLLQNPFYKPDNVSGNGEPASNDATIQNRQFVAQVNRIGEKWTPGLVTF